MDKKRVPLGDYVTEYSVRNKSDEDIPVYSVTNSQGFCTEYFDKEVASKDKKTYKIVPRGYFAYNPSRINVGSVDWQRCEDRVIVSPLYNVFYVSEEMDQQYLYYFLRSDIGRQMIKAKASGSVRDNLKMDMLKEMTIPYKTFEEQKKCVATLDELQKIIALREKEIEKLDDLIKARFVELFGEVEALTKRWNVKKFSDVTINCDSTRKPVKDADRQKMQGEYPYYGATGIVDYVNDYRIDGTYLLVSEDGKALEFRNKDIAFIAKGKIWVNNHAHVLQCTDEVDMVFLKYYMNLRNISDWVTGIDQKKLNRANMDKIPVGLPPLELQKQFSALVEQVDKSKVVAQKMLDEAQTLFDSLMQEYFG